MRTAARTDDNQAEIVAALRAAGYVVWVIKWPVDLLVGTGKAWIAMEVKDCSKPPSAQKLTPNQELFFALGGGPMAVVNDVESALRAAHDVAVSEH